MSVYRRNMSENLLTRTEKRRKNRESLYFSRDENKSRVNDGRIPDTYLTPGDSHTRNTEMNE